MHYQHIINCPTKNGHCEIATQYTNEEQSDKGDKNLKNPLQISDDNTTKDGDDNSSDDGNDNDDGNNGNDGDDSDDDNDGNVSKDDI